jgi:endonuclease G
LFGGVGRWTLGLNLAIGLALVGWYGLQPQPRREEVRRLVSSAFAEGKQVTLLDVGWDLWQLYYVEAAKGTIAHGDKSIVYGGPPILTGLSTGTPLRVLKNRGYVVGYHDAKAYPAWVAYRMADLAVPAPSLRRPERFEIDRRTAARVAPGDYSNSGYDRGHLAPNYAIASRFGEEAQRETFLMSNIVPQRHALNAGPWNQLERRISTSYPARYGEVWVFVGPILGPNPPQLQQRVPVPESFFMLILDEHEDRLRTLALIMPQAATDAQDLASYVTTIDEIERQAGLDFLRELEDPMESTIEQQRASRVW